jgi:tyrosinase
VTAGDELQSRLDAMLQDTEGAAGIAPEAGIAEDEFSPFDFAQADSASELAAELSRVRAESGLDAAITAAERAPQPPGLVKHALKVFVTHDAEARERLQLPSVESVETHEVEGEPPPPRPTTPGPAAAAAAPEAEAAPSRTEPAEERRLDWYREDPFANDHHHHWHIVYPGGGLRENGVRRTQPRQGELFFYMHQQMLARYDTERVIAGLGPVAPYPGPSGPGAPDYGTAIAEGYGAPGYVTRLPGSTPGDVTDLVDARSAVGKAIADKRLDAGGADLGPLDANQLGAAVEPSLIFRSGSALPTVERYGNLHGGGHVVVGRLGDPAPDDRYRGVMSYTETAIRDPFFYRWHRHVDDLYADFQDAQGAEQLDTYAADVRFRGDGAADVVLCFSRDVPGADAPGFDFDAWALQTLGEDLGGGDGVATDVLATRFVVSEVTAPVPGGATETYTTTHLTHEPYTLALRVENPRDAPQPVTVRVFLAHADHADRRRMWMELDKFERTLAPGVNVIAQPDARSSVVKRKGVTAPGADRAGQGSTDPWCDCGWPYTLLLPSGASSEAGTPFVLAVVLTDYEQDREPASQRTCASMSFCGARQDYPDRRRMGHPFDRRFERPIPEVLAAHPAAALRPLAIRCETARPPS